MGLFDKIKDIFTEEVDDDEAEVKVEQIKTEVRSVPIESPTVEKKEFTLPEEIEEEPKEEKAKAPVFFTERDFADLISPKKRSEKHQKKEEKPIEQQKEEILSKAYGGNYSSTSIISKESPIFKPTPIISPVYGVLDKNYQKEDIIDRNEMLMMMETVDGLSVDNIRNKAYGTLEDDLEDTIAAIPVPEEDDNRDFFEELEETIEEEIVKETKQSKNVKQIEGVTIDLTKELDNLLMKKDRFSDAAEMNSEFSDTQALSNDKNITESELFDLIDSMYEGEGEE